MTFISRSQRPNITGASWPMLVVVEDSHSEGKLAGEVGGDLYMLCKNLSESGMNSLIFYILATDIWLIICSEGLQMSEQQGLSVSVEITSTAYLNVC